MAAPGRLPVLVCALAQLLAVCLVAWEAEAAILKLGTPLAWKDSLPYLHYIRRHGVKQFVHKYQRCKAVESDELLWGDEIEYGVFKFDKLKGTYKLSLRTHEVPLCARTPLESRRPRDARETDHVLHPVLRGICVRALRSWRSCGRRSSASRSARRAARGSPSTAPGW